MLSFIIGLVFMGIVAGYLARFLVPGPDPMSFAGTMLLGVVGSFIGGFLGWLLFGNKAGALEPAGVIGSVIGAVILLIAYNAMGRGRTTDI